METYQVPVLALIKLLRDSEKGFHDLSQHMQNDHCRVYMLEESYMRQSFAAEIENLLSAYRDESVHMSGTTIGTLHRAWLDLRMDLGASDEDVLQALKTCEKAAIVAYTTVLEQESLPESIRVVAERQFQHVRPLQQRLTSLCTRAIHSQMFQPDAGLS